MDAPDTGVALPIGVECLVAPNPSALTGAGTNTYLVGDGDLIVVDPGPLDSVHREAIERRCSERHATIRYVVVTHLHADHVGGAIDLSESSGAVLLGPGAFGDIRHGAALEAGDVAAVPGARLVVHDVSGHCATDLAFSSLLELTADPVRVVFSGDLLFRDTPSLIAAGGTLVAYLSSLQRLAVLFGDDAWCAPGHGPPFRNGAARCLEVIAHRLERERSIVEALAAVGAATLLQLVALVYIDLAPERVAAASRQVEAHLEKLLAEGRVSASPAGRYELR